MNNFQLKCFISVESHLSFTKAAEDCHVVQATVSRQISMLEEELGCKLFERDSHGVRVTPAGAMLAHYAPVFLEYQKTILDQMRNASDPGSARLRFGVGPYEHLLLRGPLSMLRLAMPETGVDLTAYTYHVLLTRYRNKVLDVALCNDLCAAQMTEYLPYEIYDENWLVAAAQDSPFWSLPLQDQQALKGQSLITLVNDQYDGVRKYCYDHLINPNMVETNFLTTLMELLQSGFGVAVLPPFVAPMLPPNVIMRDILKIPHHQKFYAMLSPTLDKTQAAAILALLRRPLNDLPNE